MSTIRVFLVEDHEQVREGLTDLLNSYDGIDVIGGVATLAEAIEALTTLVPDIAVIDQQLPDGNGVALCQRIQTISPETRCIIYTSTSVAPEAATAPGVAAVLIKQLNSNELLDTIRKIAKTKP